MAATQAQIELINRHLPSLGIAPSGDLRTDVNAALGKIVELMNGDEKDASKRIQYDPAVGYTEDLGRVLSDASSSPAFEEKIEEIKEWGLFAKVRIQVKEHIPAPMKEDVDKLFAFAADAPRLLETLDTLHKNGDLAPAQAQAAPTTPAAPATPAQAAPVQATPPQQAAAPTQQPKPQAAAQPAPATPAQAAPAKGPTSEEKIEEASRFVEEKILSKLAETLGAQSIVGQFVTIPAPKLDGQLDEQELDTLYQGLAALKMSLGISPANGDFDDKTAESLTAIINTPEGQKSINELGISKDEAEAVIFYLDILNKEGVINHEKAQKATVASMGLQALRGFLGDGTVDGFISVVAGFIYSLDDKYADMINVFCKWFLGFGLDEIMMLSDNPEHHNKLTKIDFNADPATLQAQLQKVYKEAVERAGGDPVKMKEDILGYVEKLNDFRLLASSEEKQQLLDKIGGALDASGNDPAAFARIVQEAIHNRNAAPQQAPAQQPPAQQQQQAPGTPAGGSTSGGGVKREGSSTGTDKVSLFDDRAQAAMNAYDVEVGFDDTPGAKAAIGVYLVPDGSNVFVFADRNGGLQAQSMTQAELEEFFLTYAENPDSIKVEVLDISDPQRVADLRQTLQGRIKDKFNQESGAIAKAEPEPQQAKPTPPEQQPPAQPAPAQPPSAQPTPPQEQVRPSARVPSEPSDFDRLANQEDLIKLRREVQCESQNTRRGEQRYQLADGSVVKLKDAPKKLQDEFGYRANGGCSAHPSSTQIAFREEALKLPGPERRGVFGALQRAGRSLFEPDQADPSNPAHQSQPAAQSPYVIDPPR